MLADKIAVRKVTNDQDFQLAYQIRVKVFVEEQGIPESEELDDLDPKCTHFIVLDGDQAVGTCRLVPSTNNECNLGRLAVIASHRKRGLAKLLADAMEKEAIRLNYDTITIHAQTRSSGFYRKIGYKEMDKPRFLEVEIEHMHMYKQLQK